MIKWGKITYSDGSSVTGIFDPKADWVIVGNGAWHITLEKGVFEIIDPPKPVEPMNLGAVVSASIIDGDGIIVYSGLFVRGQSVYWQSGNESVWENTLNDMYEWSDMDNITVLHEGYAG